MIYCTDNWLEVEESQLNDEFLISVFAKDIYKNVYILDRGILRGVVTRGDFCRHVLHSKPLIQERFISFAVHDEEKAGEILHERANIYGIPILDKEKHIVREWCKKATEKKGYSSAEILCVYEQFMSDREGYRNFLVLDLSNPKDAETAQKINKKAFSRLLVLDEKEVTNIDKYIDGLKVGMVYDAVQKFADFYSIIYRKKKVQYSFIRKSNVSREVVEHHLLFYGSMGIMNDEIGALGENDEYFQMVSIFDKDKFVWDAEKGCPEYVGNMNAERIPEILWVSCCFLKNPVIFCQGRMIPIAADSYPIYEQRALLNDIYKLGLRKFSDYDIAYNILPKLLRGNVRFVVISGHNSDFEKIEACDRQELRRRNALLNSGCYLKSLPNTFINQSGNVQTAEFEREICLIYNWNKRGYKQQADFAGKYTNIYQGERRTVGNLEQYAQVLWLFGPCIIRGYYVDDISSVGSVLRKKIDKSYYIKNMGLAYETQNLSIRDAVFRRGDIAVIYGFDMNIYEAAGLRVHDVLRVYEKCPDIMEHMIDLPEHADAYLTKRLADGIYDVLLEEKFLEKNLEEVEERYGTESFCLRKEKELKVPSQLEDWLSKVRSYRGKLFSETGAIVMNCNPFTLGHRYLIEKACEQVDKLLLFVVEEDKSFFRFKDRLRMVELGTKDLEKVVVIPSGKYIISSETMPGYFEKEENPDIILDATDDLEFFAKVIAKELRISVRFAGEEPFDGYTRQYNQAMRRILPENDIKFIEIARKECDGQVISASRVRKLMREERYEVIKELVMPQVYTYLRKHYFGGS